MSNWLSEYSGEEQKQVDDLNAQGLQHKPIKGKSDPGLFQGSLTAPFRGVAAGMVKTYDAAAKPFERIKDHVEYSIEDVMTGGLEGPLDVRRKTFQQYHDEQNKIRNNLLVAEIEQLEDRENTGTVGAIGFGLSDYITRAFFGSAVGGIGGAVAVTGASETNYSYEYLTNKGVDSNTALGVSLIDGVVAGGSAGLPMMYGFKGTGGLIKDAALSVGSATGLSVGGQALSGEVLESSGYEKQAKKYEITWESLGTEVALNALLFGGSRYAKYKLSDDVDVELRDLTVEEIEAKNTAVEATLEVNRMQFENETSPVNPADPIQENNHLINLNAAEQQLRAGQPVNVPKDVQGTPKAIPNFIIKPSEYKSIRYDDPRLDSVLHSKAKEMDMDWATPLLLAIRRAGEKSHNNQVSPVGAKSIMQIMPDTQKGLERNYKKKWDINNPEHATEMALYLVREMSQQYKTKDPLVLAAHYNGGFSNGKAMQKNGKPKATETINYVNRVRNFINNGEYKKYSGNNISQATGMDGSTYLMASEIKSLDDLIASNDAAFGVNPNYPAELQPRDRTRAASMQQIEDMANGLRPEFLGESPKLSDGSPILGPDNVVESGNGRTMAIRQAYETGKADEYRNFVDQYAREKGWDISGINNPILVRTRLTETDRVEFARLANESDVAQFSPTERSRTDADRLPDSSAIKINNDGSINLDGSMDFVRGFLDQLPQSERANLMTADGHLSQGGKQRIESALAQRAYGDSNLVTRLYENLDDDSKTVLNALLRAAPQLTQLGDLVKQGGRHQNTIAADLAQAAQKLSDLKANGQTVKDYLNQGQLIDDGLSPGAKEFLSVFDSNSRSAKAISEQIQAKIDEVEARGDPRQGSLFGETAEEQEALKLAYENPNEPISVSREGANGEVEVITMTLRDYIDELNGDAKAAQERGVAAEAAARCFLSHGV